MLSRNEMHYVILYQTLREEHAELISKSAALYHINIMHLRAS